MGKSVLASTIPRIFKLFVCRSKDFILLLFVLNLWFITFHKTAGVLFSCSFVATFQEATSVIESVF